MEDAKGQRGVGSQGGNPPRRWRRVARMKAILAACSVAALTVLMPLANGAQAPAASTAHAGPPPPPPGYTHTGADTCLLCHNTPKVRAIFSTKHAVMADSRTPFAGNQCEACHGPGGRHVQPPAKGEKRTPVPFFAPNSPA